MELFNAVPACEKLPGDMAKPVFTGAVALRKGLFPDSAIGLEQMRFWFVHLGLDLYDSTAAALEWFWPRISSGGILLSHDYPLIDGVVQAFHEFFDGRPEPFIPLSGNQCMAVKY